MTNVIASIGIWTGAVVGILKVVDWLLSDRQKKWLVDRSVDLWVWLQGQRAGRFIGPLRSRLVQRGFIFFTHAALVCLAGGFLLRVFLGWHIPADVQIGHPRLYPFQVWIDIAAVLGSAALLSWSFHPRLSLWITSAPTLPRYFLRTTAAFATCVALMSLILLAESPIIGFDSPAFNESFSETQVVSAYEHMLGGKMGVMATHALTATVSAPVMAETFLTMTILFLSIYWLIIVYGLMATFKLLSFTVERVAQSKEGPVLALSGLLIGIGAIARALLGK